MRAQNPEEIVVTELGMTTTIEPRFKYKLASSNTPRLNRIRKVLAALDRPMTAMQLAQEVRVFPSNMHRTLNALENAGWIAKAGIVHVGHNRPARLWRRCARLVFEDEFLVSSQ